FPDEMKRRAAAIVGRRALHLEDEVAVAVRVAVEGEGDESQPVAPRMARPEVGDQGISIPRRASPTASLARTWRGQVSLGRPRTNSKRPFSNVRVSAGSS